MRNSTFNGDISVDYTLDYTLPTSTTCITAVRHVVHGQSPRTRTCTTCTVHVHVVLVLGDYTPTRRGRYK